MQDFAVRCRAIDGVAKVQPCWAVGVHASRGALGFQRRCERGLGRAPAKTDRDRTLLANADHHLPSRAYRHSSAMNRETLATDCRLPEIELRHTALEQPRIVDR